MDVTQEQIEDAKQLYGAYIRATGGKAFNGDPLPDADEFFQDRSKSKQQAGWIFAACEFLNYLDTTGRLRR